MTKIDIQVALVEDEPEIRQLMQLLIDGSPGFACTQAYASCEIALQEMHSPPPNIVLMDIDLPQMSGIEGVKKLKEIFPDINIIMLTIHEDDKTIFNALCAGAVGYLVKGLPPVKLLQAIEEAHRGGSPMSASIARKVVQHFHPQTVNPLSERETEVLQLLCNGENYKSIAKALFISSNTVKAHIKHIYAKLHVNNRAEAVSQAIRKKIVD